MNCLRTSVSVTVISKHVLESNALRIIPFERKPNSLLEDPPFVHCVHFSSRHAVYLISNYMNHVAARKIWRKRRKFLERRRQVEQNQSTENFKIY